MQSDDGRRLRPTRRQAITAAGASALALSTGVGFADAHLASGHVFDDRAAPASDTRTPASPASWFRTAAT